MKRKEAVTWDRQNGGIEALHRISESAPDKKGDEDHNGTITSSPSQPNNGE